MQRSAQFDASRRYRYRLQRSWDGCLPCLAWVMLNPNNADEYRDDPTIRRCVAFAQMWGYGSIEVVNLFALRAREPRDLLSADDPIGEGNAAAVADALQASHLVVAAWGSWGCLRQRAQAFRSRASRDLYCLGVTTKGEPRHPLYLPGDTRPRLFHSCQL